MTTERRENLWITFRTKVIPTLLAACILSLASASVTIVQKANKVLEIIEAHDARLTAVEKEQIMIKSQMVSWETLGRIERTLATLAATGRGGEAMRSMSTVIRNELDARKDNPVYGGR